jgi:hypothetical protein
MSYLTEIIERLQEAEDKLVFTNMDPSEEETLTTMGVLSFAGKEKSVNEALRKRAHIT